MMKFFLLISSFVLHLTSVSGADWKFFSEPYSMINLLNLNIYKIFHFCPHMIFDQILNGTPIFFSCPEQLNRWPCHSLTESLSHSLSQYFYFWHTQSDTRELWPLKHPIRELRRHDLTEKNTYQPTDQPTCLPVYLPRSTPLREEKLLTLWNRNDSIDVSLACEDSWVRSQTLPSSCTEFITHSFADT